MVIGGSSLAAVELANLKGTTLTRSKGLEAYKALVDGKISLQPSADAVLEMALNSLAHTAGTIYELPWTLLRAKSGSGSFLCSDRPLTMFDPVATTQVVRSRLAVV